MSFKKRLPGLKEYAESKRRLSIDFIDDSGQENTSLTILNPVLSVPIGTGSTNAPRFPASSRRRGGIIGITEKNTLSTEVSSILPIIY